MDHSDRVIQGSLMDGGAQGNQCGMVQHFGVSYGWEILPPLAPKGRGERGPGESRAVHRRPVPQLWKAVCASVSVSS